MRGLVYADGQFVGVGTGGTILTSSDGISFTPRASPTTDDLYAVAFGSGVFAAVGVNGAIVTSTDGLTWSGS